MYSINRTLLTSRKGYVTAMNETWMTHHSCPNVSCSWANEYIFTRLQSEGPFQGKLNSSNINALKIFDTKKAK